MRAALQHDPGELRERARELLSRPPYRQEADGPLERAWTRVWEWVAEVLAGLQDAVAGSGVWGWVITWLGALALVAVIWRLTRGMALDPRGAPTGEHRAAGPSARERERRAQALAREQRWDEAVRERYRSLVAALAEAGIVDEASGSTVGEIDRAVSARAPKVASHVALAGQRFAAVAYGRAAAGEAEYHDVDRAVGALRAVDAGPLPPGMSAAAR